jgi:hypothetical protein
VLDIEIAAEFLQQDNVSSYETNCPLRTTGDKRKVPWCSSQLGRLYWEIRKLLNNVKETGVASSWESFRWLRRGTKGPLVALSERTRKSSVMVSMKFQVHRDSTKSLLTIPKSDLALFVSFQ